VGEALGVGGHERAADLDRVGDRLGHRQRAGPADELLQRLAVDVLEDDERMTGVLAGVDHGHQMRVGEPGDRARLTAEALQLHGVVVHRLVKDLHRHPALERLVEGSVDRRHPAGADALLEPVALA
jgi:hypothetical protein